MAGYSDEHFGDDGSVTQHRHAGLYSKFRVYFHHGPSSDKVSFPAILTEFSDNFQSNWSKEEYFGRMDPVAKFKNTIRKINFQITVIADESSDAVTNMLGFQKLTRMLYPTYRSSPDAAVNGTGNANLISSAPLIGIQMGNLIHDSKTRGEGEPIATPLMGYVDGFEFRPEQEATWYLADGLDSTDRRGIKNFGQSNQEVMDWANGAKKQVLGSIYLPSKFTLGVSFNVVHQHSLGWSENGEWLNGASDYPYRMKALGESMPDDLKEKAIIQRTSKLGPKAPIVKAVKQGLLSKIFFGPN